MAYTITEEQAANLITFATAIVGPHIKTGFVREAEKYDYIQELLQIIVENQDNWEIPTAISFETFATVVMRKRFFSIWRKLHPKNGNPLNSAISLDVTYKNEDNEDEKFINNIAEDGYMANNQTVISIERKRQVCYEVSKFVESLKAEDRELCELRSFCSIDEIAQILNIHKNQSDRRLRRIRRAMINCGLKELL